MDAPRQKLSDQ